MTARKTSGTLLRVGVVAGVAAIAAFGLSRRGTRAARQWMAAAASALPLGHSGTIACEAWDSGTGLAGYHWPASSPRGIVLLQHGFAEYSERYVEGYATLIPRLLAAGLSVYAIDLPGHGRSPGRPVLLDAERAVQAHLAARRVLSAQPLPLLLYGHSLGGLVTTASAARDHSGIAGVVLSSAFLGGSYPTMAVTLALGLARLAPALPLVDLPPEQATYLADKVMAVRQDSRMWHGRMPVLLAATMARMAYGLPTLLTQWTVPTLVIHGTADTFTECAGSERLFAAIASTDKEAIFVPDGRHELLNDHDGDALADRIVGWMAARAAPVADE